MLDKYPLTKIVSMNNELLKSEFATRPELDLKKCQKLFLSLIVSKIDKDDTNFFDEEISVNEFCDLFDINRNGGTNKKAIYNSLLDIKNKSFIPANATSAKDTLCWVEDIQIDENGIVKVKLSEALKRYYLNLDKHFTAYQLGYISNLNSKYSIAVYEMLKSKQSLTVFYYKVSDAKKELARGKYQSFSDLKRFVLDPAIEEINVKTDITVTYKTHMNGPKYDLILFCVKSKCGEALALADYWKIRYNSHEKNMIILKEEYEDVFFEIECGDLPDQNKDKKEYEETMKKLRYDAEVVATAESKEIRDRFQQYLKKTAYDNK